MGGIDGFIAAGPFDEGIRRFSPPVAFAMDEHVYDERVGARHGDHELAAGAGVHALYRHFGGRPDGVALELGAGSGAATLGYVRAALDQRVIVTDPSPAFLDIVKAKLRHGEGPHARLTFGTLAGEDLATFPPQSLDLVFLQACLHHLRDPGAFLADAATVLRPGGLLLAHEPFAEGSQLLVLALETMLAFDGTRYALTSDDRARVGGMIAAITFQIDRGADKSAAEDKHCFFVDQLLPTAWRHFAEVHFFRNQTFETIGARLECAMPIDVLDASACSVTEYLRGFMRHHHGVSDQGVRHFDDHVAPVLATLDRLARQGDAPAIFGTLACRTAL